MAPHDETAELIPWYAAGTLDGEERQRVEAYIEQSAEGRELLEIAVQAAQQARTSGLDAFDRELHPALLAEYVTAPDGLEGDVRARIAQALQGDIVSADAVRIAREAWMAAESAAESGSMRSVSDDAASRPAKTTEAPSLADKVWSFLTRTLLQPAPALAYLLLFAVGVPIYVSLRGGDDAPVALSPNRQTLGGELTLRDPNAPTPAPATLPRETMLLELPLDLDDVDPADRFDVTVSREAATIFETTQRGDQLIQDTLLLVLDARRLESGVEHQITVRQERETVYQRRFVVTP